MTDDRLATYDALARFFSSVLDDLHATGYVETDDLWDSAVLAGLAEQVDYDPELHGEMDCEPGDTIHVLSPLGARAVDRADALAAAVDDAVRIGALNSRSRIADARLDYGKPGPPPELPEPPRDPRKAEP